MLADHPKQLQFRKSSTRFKFCLAGRRGGKTLALREMLLENVIKAPDWTDTVYFGPTNATALELMWEATLDRLDELQWKYVPRISKQRIDLSRGRKIYFIGAERVRRIRGKRLWYAILDEVGYFSTPLAEVWRAVRPTLSDFSGSAVLATTPTGKNSDAYNFYIEVLKKSEEWEYFHWRTTDNPAISKDEIEAAKRDLDPKSFKQEYEAEWESFDGLAYYCFQENLHIKKTPGLNPGIPLALAFDFNVNPTTLLMIQELRPGIHSVIREYSQANSSTLETVRSFCEDHKHLAQSLQILIYGDASGSSRKSNVGRSDYSYVEEMLNYYGFKYAMRVPAANPPIIDRVSHANAWLKNVKGETKLEIDPTCSDVIRDLSSQPLDGRFPSQSNNLGHKADALGYYIHWKHVLDGRKPQHTVQL